MTTNKAKQGGAPPKKNAQPYAKKNVVGAEKTPRPSPDVPGDENGEPYKTAEMPGADGPERTFGSDAEASLDERTDDVGAERARQDETGVQPVQDEDANAKYVRLAADFQNYKRRVEKEKNDIYAYANEKMAVGLLEVIDNFERALESHDGADGREEGFAKGMKLIFKQLLDILLKNGVEEIQSLGEDFDPAVHHAVMMEESETYESGKVSAVLGKGYRLKERVIRPAMVKVAQ
ncbi:MAG: nucleotide exchange factor GrpE [Clostridiales Family XIII bacterium]|jgi:molecular chaperone GrpE|nr:nucleotide exchange factor GrpE [Clostridiales Family XIII bacterium]